MHLLLSSQSGAAGSPQKQTQGSGGTHIADWNASLTFPAAKRGRVERLRRGSEGV